MWGITGSRIGDRVKSGAVVLPQSSIPAPQSLFHHFRLGDDDILFRNVLVATAKTGRHLTDSIHHISAFHHFAEDAVPPAILPGMIEKAVIFHINEKLRSGGMRVRSARHGNGISIIAQTVCRLVFNRRLGGFFLHAWLKAATLDHEPVNHAVKNGVVVEAAVYIIEKI